MKLSVMPDERDATRELLRRALAVVGINGDVVVYWEQEDEDRVVHVASQIGLL